jgi:hypothetical protein
LGEIGCHTSERGVGPAFRVRAAQTDSVRGAIILREFTMDCEQFGEFRERGWRKSVESRELVLSHILL